MFYSLLYNTCITYKAATLELVGYYLQQACWFQLGSTKCKLAHSRSVPKVRVAVVRASTTDGDLARSFVLFDRKHSIHVKKQNKVANVALKLVVRSLL